MGIFDSILGGPKPVLRGPSAGEAQLRSIGNELYGGTARAGYTNLSSLALDAARAGRAGELSQLRGMGAADVNQALAGPAQRGTVVSRALTRATGLARIARATTDQFNGRLLRERMGLVQGGRGRIGTGLQAMSQAANWQDQYAQAQAGVDMAKKNALGTFIGTALGIGAGYAPDIADKIRTNRAMKASIPAGGDYTGSTVPHA